MSLRKVIWDTFIDWCQNSTIAGVSRTVKSKSYVKKLYWITLFLVGVYFTIITTYNVFDDYFLYEVRTTTDLSYETSIPFPAVTICNQNRFVISMKTLGVLPYSIQNWLRTSSEIRIRAEVNSAFALRCFTSEMYQSSISFCTNIQ